MPAKSNYDRVGDIKCLIYNKPMDEYIPPILTIDGVIFQILNNELQVLLIQRTNEPFKDAWALPGGYNPRGETTKQALARIVKKKTGVDVAKLKVVEQLYTFDAVGRDPRGHAVAVSYLALGADISFGGKDTENPTFFPVAKLPELAYDHGEIINFGYQRLVSELNHSNIAFSLLPEVFTLTQLQTVYEAIMGKPLDKRNFRKYILKLDLVKETGQMFREGAYRPAKLYEFVDKTLKSHQIYSV